MIGVGGSVSFISPTCWAWYVQGGDDDSVPDIDDLEIGDDEIDEVFSSSIYI